MAEEVRVSDPSAEEAGEPIHLPGPSYLPVATAFGLTIAIVGVVLSWVIVGIGVVIAVIAIVALDRRDAPGDRRSYRSSTRSSGAYSSGEGAVFRRPSCFTGI